MADEMKRKISTIGERWANDGFGNPKPSEITQCFFCKNALKGEFCLAFPEGIPENILNNDFIHDTEYMDDKGIRFEPEKEEYRNIKFESLTKIQKF